MSRVLVLHQPPVHRYADVETMLESLVEVSDRHDRHNAPS